MIVPLPDCQPCGTSPTTRWFGPDSANVAALAVPGVPLLELGVTVAYAPIAAAMAIAIAAAPIAMDLTSFRGNIERLRGRWV
jgi:hypothetical protein